MSHTWEITFANPTIPNKLKIGFLALPYIPNPMRYFKCQLFGHHQGYCKTYFTSQRVESVPAYAQHISDSSTQVDIPEGVSVRTVRRTTGSDTGDGPEPGLDILQTEAGCQLPQDCQHVETDGEISML